MCKIHYTMKDVTYIYIYIYIMDTFAIYTTYYMLYTVEYMIYTIE